jgi:hypothetical protein
MATSVARVMVVASQVAAGQWGLLTTAQAEYEGVTRLQLARRTSIGVLERVDRGVYATTSSPTEHRALRAAWLELGPKRTAEERLATPTAITPGTRTESNRASWATQGDP